MRSDQLIHNTMPYGEVLVSNLECEHQHECEHGWTWYETHICAHLHVSIKYLYMICTLSTSG